MCDACPLFPFTPLFFSGSESKGRSVKGVEAAIPLLRFTLELLCTPLFLSPQKINKLFHFLYHFLLTINSLNGINSQMITVHWMT